MGKGNKNKAVTHRVIKNKLVSPPVNALMANRLNMENNCQIP